MLDPFTWREISGPTTLHHWGKLILQFVQAPRSWHLFNLLSTSVFLQLSCKFSKLCTCNKISRHFAIVEHLACARSKAIAFCAAACYMFPGLVVVLWIWGFSLNRSQPQKRKKHGSSLYKIAERLKLLPAVDLFWFPAPATSRLHFTRAGTK